MAQSRGSLSQLWKRFSLTNSGTLEEEAGVWKEEIKGGGEEEAEGGEAKRA